MSTLREAEEADIVDSLGAIVGREHCLTAPDSLQRYVTEWRGLFTGSALAVVRPRDAHEISAVLRFAARNGLSVVPQGGNTGACGGAVPQPNSRSIVLSLERMNTILSIDPFSSTMTVGAGCILTDIQRAAEEAGFLFPLSLGAEGSCQIGGNIATNAGGIRVLRYGNTRDAVLGLEVVLADGTIVDALRGLRKDNAGYDLKQIFIGSEGTLGIVTAATLRLERRWRDRRTAFLAVPDVPAALRLLSATKVAFDDRVVAFELLMRNAVTLPVRHLPGVSDPFPEPYPAYVLLEVASSQPPEQSGFEAILEETLAAALDSGDVLDAVLPSSIEQRNRLWRMREGVGEALKATGFDVKFDVSLPLSLMPAFLERAGAAVEATLPGVSVVAFGHLGDGNLHYNLAPSASVSPDALRAAADSLGEAVLAIVVELGGSIAAEHGIGQLKRDKLRHFKSPGEYALMQRLKAALDPAGLLNPGKVIFTIGEDEQ